MRGDMTGGLKAIIGIVKFIFVFIFTISFIGFLVSISISFILYIFYIFSYSMDNKDDTVERIVTEEEAAQVKEWFDKGYRYSLTNEHDMAIESYTRAIESYTGAIKTSNTQKRFSSPSRVYFGSGYWNVLGYVVMGFIIFSTLLILNVFYFYDLPQFKWGQGLIFIILTIILTYGIHYVRSHWGSTIVTIIGLVGLVSFFLQIFNIFNIFKFIDKLPMAGALIILNALILSYGINYVRDLQSFTSVKVSNNGSWSLRNAFGIPIGYIGLAEEIEVNYMEGKSVYLGKSYRESPYHFVEIHAGNKKYRSCNNEIKYLAKAEGDIMQTRNSIHKDLTLYPRAYNNRGDAYYYKREYDMAIEDYHRAIELKPTFAAAFFNCGLANTKKGYIEAAQINYKTACDLGYDEGCKNLQKISQDEIH